MKIINYIKIDGDTGLCRVKVTPKQPKTEFFSVLDDGTIKIRLKAAPEKGKANKELVSFLAGELGISKNDIDIIAGVGEQLKILKFKNLKKYENNNDYLSS